MYETHKEIFCKKTGEAFLIGDTVSIKHKNGGGCGSCTIVKITDTGFHFRQGNSRVKIVQYKDIAEIY